MTAGESATTEQALEIVRVVLGETPASAERMPFGHRSVTYDVALADGSAVIVRTNADPAVFAATERNLTTLRGLDLPVPRVLASDPSRSRRRFAWMVLEKVPGRDLRYELPAMTRPQMTRVAEQIVGFQRRVATLPDGAGFGYVPIGGRGPFPTWPAFLGLNDGDGDGSLAWLHQAEGDAASAALAAYVARIDRSLRRPALRDYLDSVRPTCFLDDVTTKNVIVEGGELRGLIDFDVVCYGDALLQVGLTAAGVASDVGLEALFYVEELRRLSELTPERERAADLYSAQMTVGFLRRLFAEGAPEWRARMLTALERWVSALEG